MGRLLLNIILIFLLGFFVSCKKDEPKQKTEIEILYPPENTAFVVGDTIMVTLHLKDQEIIRSVRLAVTDGSSAVLPVQYNYPLKNEATINLYVPVNNRLIETGSYWIEVKTNNGIIETRAFRQTLITGLEKEVMGIIVVSRAGVQETQLNFLNTKLIIDSTKTISKSHAFSAINNQYQQFYFVSTETSQLTAYSLDDLKPYWEWGAAPSHNAVTDITVADFLYIATANGDIFGLDENGTTIMQTQVLLDYLPLNIAVNVDMNELYAYQQAINGAQAYNSIYYKQSGDVKYQVYTNEEVVNYIPNGGGALYFSNDNGNLVINLWETDFDKSTKLKSIPGKHCYYAARIDDNLSIFRADDDLYTFDLHNFHIDLFMMDAPFDKLTYEALSQSIVAVKEQELYQINYLTAQFTDTLEFDQPILDFHIHYNK